MATIINNPGNTDSGAGPVAIVIGVLVLLGIIALFVFYGLPAMGGNAPAQNDSAIDVQVTVPAPAAAEGPAAESAQN